MIKNISTKKLNRVFIRADANSKIGTGHVMRCITIAESLIDMGVEVVFLPSDNNSAALIRSYGYSAHVLNTERNNLKSEIPVLCNYLKENIGSCILVDSYYATEEYYSAIKNLIKVVIVDDLEMVSFSCDMIINYNVYSDDIWYNYNYPNVKKLLGCNYVPLRKEFHNLPPKNINNKVKRVLITCGGADPYHFILNLSRVLKKQKNNLKEIFFYIICGRYNLDYEKIRETLANYSNITVIQHSDNVLSIMKDADIAISAGGSTLYELCACGTPTISYIFADNQIKNAKGFMEKGLITYVGDIRDKRFYYDKIIEALKLLIDDAKYRLNVSIKMQNLVDGLGASRIAQELTSTFII